jgi:ribose transport system substrate-binding protein
MMIRNIRRAGIFAAAATAGILLLAGCSSTASPSATSSSIKLAAVVANTSDPFWATVTCGVKGQAKKLGVSLQLFNTTTTDTNTIASNFQSASLTNPDGMIVQPFNNNQFVAQYTKLMNSGVPVVTANGTTPQVNYQTIYSGTDTAGIASEVKDLIPSGSGTMVVMGGAPGIPPLETRTQPFIKAVQKMRSDLTPLSVEYSGFDINKATTDASSLIIAHPDLKLIIAADGPDGVAAAAAVKQAGKTGKIAIIAFDAVPNEVEALKAGQITALIAQDPYKIGSESVTSLVDYLKSHKSGGAVKPAGSTTIDNKLLTKATVDDAANLKYQYKATC